jgi:hypothetical protein
MLQWCATCWHVSHAIVLAAHVAAEFMHPAWLVDTAKHCIQKPLPAGGCKLGDAVLADLVEQLNACAADVMAGDWLGALPVHRAAEFGHTATCQLLLDRAPQTAVMVDFDGRTPLQFALLAVHHHHMCLDAARCLVAAAPVASVVAALVAVPQALPLFADFFITRSPHLTSEEWMAAWSAVPAPCPGLLRALPAVPAHSAEQARHLVQHLPPADVQRLRTAALCMARAQKQSAVALPSAVVWQVLQLIGA